MTVRLEVLLLVREAAVRAALSEALRRRGHAARALRVARVVSALPDADVLVCDLQMPRAFALDLAEELRAGGKRARMVVLADALTNDEWRRALGLGVCDVVLRPFRIEELVRAVETADTAGETGPARRADARSGPPRDCASVHAATPDGAEEAVRHLLALALRCGMRPSVRARIGSATCEILDNARRHAGPGSRGTIEVRARSGGGSFSVTVRDEGRGLDPALLHSLEAGGELPPGLARARALSEELHARSAPGQGTEITLAFASAGACFEEELGLDLSELDHLTPLIARRLLARVSDPSGAHAVRLSPALAVVVGRLLADAGPSAGSRVARTSLHPAS